MLLVRADLKPIMWVPPSMVFMLWVYGGLGLGEVLDEAHYSALVLELVELLGPFVLYGYLYPGVQERKFSQALAQGVETEIGHLEYFGVRLERHGRAGLFCFAFAGQGVHGLAPLVPLLEYLAVPFYFDVEPLRHA